MKSMGLGTAVDALTSLARVYEVPLVLYVSWAGYRGRDVPHHNVLGEVLGPFLDSLRIPSVRHTIGRLDEFAAALHRAVRTAREGRCPVALLGVPAELEGVDAGAA
jgi:phosphonopyruvate decarboxylase